MPPCLVVRTGPFNRRIVLGHVKVNHPWPQHARHAGKRIVEHFLLRPVVTFWKDPVFRSVVTESEKKCMCHVRLQTQRFRPIHQDEQLGHMLPAVHSAPADLAFCSQSFPVALCNRARFAEGFGDTFCITNGVLRPLRRTAGGINANDSVWANAYVPELLCNCTRLTELREKILPLFCRSHCRASSGGRPHRSDERSDGKVSLSNPIGKALEIIVR